MNRLTIILAALMAALMPLLALAQETNPPPGTPPLDGLSNFALWSLIAGFATPWIVAVINRQRWGSEVKYGMFLFVCIVTSGINSAFNRSLVWDDWVRSLLLVVAAGVATYMTGKKAISAVEAATS